MQAPDLTLQLPHDLYYQVIHALTAALPPPVHDREADRRRRDRAAIAQVACLLPANGDEATLAAQTVAANAQALECLRLSRLYPRNLELAMRCSAQAAAMMRQARGARSLLTRTQAERQKREADATTLAAAERLEHCTAHLMADALEPAMESAPEPMAEQPPPAEPPTTEPPTDLHKEAEHYAIIYPERVALIRSLGRLPDPCDFGPMPPALLQALVSAPATT